MTPRDRSWADDPRDANELDLARCLSYVVGAKWAATDGLRRAECDRAIRMIGVIARDLERIRRIREATA